MFKRELPWGPCSVFHSLVTREPFLGVRASRRIGALLQMRLHCPLASALHEL